MVIPGGSRECLMFKIMAGNGLKNGKTNSCKRLPYLCSFIYLIHNFQHRPPHRFWIRHGTIGVEKNTLEFRLQGIKLNGDNNT